MADYDWSAMRKSATTTLEGEFTLAFVEATAKKSQNGKDMIGCKLKVVGGPFAGRTVYHNFVVSPESQFAMQMFFTDMETLGMGDEFFATGPSMELIASNLINQEIIAVLENKPFNGRDREQVKQIMSASAAAGGFSSGGGLAAMAASTPASSPTVAEPNTAPPDDPF